MLEVHTLQVLLLWEPERMDGMKAEKKKEQDQSLCKETVDLKLAILFMATTDTKSRRKRNIYIYDFLNNNTDRKMKEKKVKERKKKKKKPPANSLAI